MNGQALSDADTARARVMAWTAYKTALSTDTKFNWHLDLETFPLFPYKNGVTFLVPFYDPGTSAPQEVAYTVTGSAKLEGYDQQPVDCWLLEHRSKGNHEKFWISKKTLEVLKLEQTVNDSMFRFKIKLPFSN